MDSFNTDARDTRSKGRTGPGPELHDATSGLVRVGVFEPQSLLRPVLLQVGQLLTVDGPTALPADGDRQRVIKPGLDTLLRPPPPQETPDPESYSSGTGVDRPTGSRAKLGLWGRGWEAEGPGTQLTLASQPHLSAVPRYRELYVFGIGL